MYFIFNFFNNFVQQVLKFKFKKENFEVVEGK